MKPVTIHSSIRVQSDNSLLSGSASLGKDYVIKPGEKVWLTFYSDQTLKLAPRTTYVIRYTFMKTTWEIRYSPVNSFSGEVEYN